MLAFQGVATVAVARRSSTRWARVLGMLGGLMAPGYPSERHGQRLLSRNGWDRLESPLRVVSIVLSAAMALLASRVRP